MRKNKKILYTLLALLTAISMSGCGRSFSSESGETGEASISSEEASSDEMESSSSVETEEKGETEMEGNENHERYIQNGYKALFADPYLRSGITVKAPSGNTSGTIYFADFEGVPSWTFSQWGSKYDLANYADRSYTEGGAVCTYTSNGAKVNGATLPGKVLSVNTKTGSIYMELNAEVEYDAPRKSGEGWPHTLLSQEFGNNLIHVPDLKELVMSIDYTVTKCEDKMNGEADRGLHCGQLVWYITLQNRTKDSAGYGEYVWFGLQLWDNRTQGGAVSEFAAEDAGKADATHAFIYNPGGEKFLKNGRQPMVGERNKIDFDVIETAKYALETAKKRGFLPNTNWEDIYVGGMNFGFEVTGTYNVSAKIDSVGVYYK